MIVQNHRHDNESYTHDNWVYRDMCVGFSLMYYIIDGEAYYEEDGKKIRLKKGHLYLTPVKKCYSLTKNPQNKLLHTYSHINTFPAINRLMEIEVPAGSALADAIALWRKYIHSGNFRLQSDVIQFVLSCAVQAAELEDSVAVKTKKHLDEANAFTLNMKTLQKELGYSREYITRSFFDAYRLTPKQYFNIRKMNVALEILRSGASVSEIAEELGYSSAYAFSKAFKNHFGASPKKYLLTLK